MSPTTVYLLVAVLIVVAVLIILWIYRDRLKLFVFKINREGVSTELEAHKPASPLRAKSAAPEPRSSVEISGNQQKGTGNQINVGRGDTRVRDNTQTGKDNKIDVKPGNP